MPASPILMPKLGLTMTEGVLASWAVKPGDSVMAGDVLFVAETDKIANEVEARESGTILTIEVAAGETAPVGAILATWTGPASDAGPASVAAEEPQAARAPVPNGAAGQSTGRVIATPLARRLARAAAIDIGAIDGSGPRGRVKAIDVERHRPIAEVRPPAPMAGETSRPATAAERTVARRLTESKQTIPHFYVLADADVTKLLALRQELNAEAPAVKISVNHCIITAMARALARMPEQNAVWRDGRIVISASIDIGVAIDTPRGLLAPVLRGVGGLPLPLLAERADELVRRAREGRLEASDIEGGVVSISNVGMYGASFLVPIINPGQSAILGVGAPKQVFRPDATGKPALREEIGLVLSCDHRVLDGVRAAILLNHVSQALEHPLRLLMP